MIRLKPVVDFGEPAVICELFRNLINPIAGILTHSSDNYFVIVWILLCFHHQQLLLSIRQSEIIFSMISQQ